MKNRLFAIIQRLGRSLMLPIAILPIAGLLLGIGSIFTNETTINAYHLQAILGDGTILNKLLIIFDNIGSGIFDNLPIIFAAGIALGMARKEKGVAVFSSIIAFLAFHYTINSLLIINNVVSTTGKIIGNVPSGAITTEVGIQTLEMGVFGGLIVGLGVAYLHNRFYKIKLPTAISFFGGTNFVPIISTLVFIVVGIVAYFIWPVIQSFIYSLGNVVNNTGYLGTFIFGLIKRALVPFGLHHIFYLPFWQTALGGTMEVGGKLIEGAQNIFFAQLNDPNTIKYSVDATKYFTGEFIFMMFGLPGAAFAMYKCAKPERKKIVAGLMISASLTSILTGITEPIEFAFLLASPLLFGVHLVLAATTYVVAQVLNITIGLTFSAGLIDFIFFGVLQGNAKTNWMLIIPLGILYFGLYYFSFKYLILKFNLKTPGREDEEIVETNTQESKAELIIKGLGGIDNFKDVENCVTRLRVNIQDPNLINEPLLKQSGAAGTMLRGDNLQIIYGPTASNIKTELEDYIIQNPKRDLKKLKVDLDKHLMLYSLMDGIVCPIEKAQDEMFSTKTMGDGFMIEPASNKVYAPCDGVITMIFPTKHAIGIKTKDDVELLLHFGINTVALNGQGFDVKIEMNQEIKRGQ